MHNKCIVLLAATLRNILHYKCKSERLWWSTEPFHMF